MSISRPPCSGPTGLTVSRDELIALGRRVGGSPDASGRRVATPLASGSVSRFYGTGLEFAEVRAYQPGDDVRAIDWRVTARTGRAHSKLFEVERERPVWLVADLGASMRFATRGVFKSVAAARAAALLAWRAHHAGERVGGIVTSPGASVEIPLGRTRAHLLRLLDALATATRLPAQARGDAPLAHELGWLREHARTGSQVVVASDFYGLDDAVSALLAALARRCEVLLVWVYDRLEAEAPPPGRYRVCDGSRTQTLVARRGRSWRAAYAAAFTEREQRLRELASRHRAALSPLRTDEPVTALLSHPGRPAPAQRAS
jgi:uncharacterized protein (DUF58 family)